MSNVADITMNTGQAAVTYCPAFLCMDARQIYICKPPHKFFC